MVDMRVSFGNRRSDFMVRVEGFITMDGDVFGVVALGIPREGG
jgi:hypothetical protein